MERAKIRGFIAVGLASVVLSGCATSIGSDNRAGLEQGDSNKSSQLADIKSIPLPPAMSFGPPHYDHSASFQEYAQALLGGRSGAPAHFWDD